MSARRLFSRVAVCVCSRTARRAVSLLALCLALFGPLDRLQAGTSNSLMDISADGKWLACSNRDSGTVTIVDLAARKVVREIAVGKKPEGVTFLGDTAQLAVCVYGDDQIALLDALSGEITARIDVFDEPYGIVSSPDGRTAWATLDYPGQVVVVDVPGRKLVRTIPAGPFARGIALASAEGRLYVTEYYTGTVLAIQTETGKIVDRWVGSRSDNLARQIAVHPTRPKAYVPHIRSRTNVNQGEGSIVPFVAVLDTAPGEGRRRNPVPMDSFHSVFVVANPWEVSLSPDGRQFAAVFAGTNDMYVCDVLDDDYIEIKYRRVLNLGHNPRAVRYAPDGRTFYVYNALDFNIMAFSADSLQRLDVIPVCDNPLGEELLQGKILFYSALQPMVGRRWISCSSCHPDGEPDARTWQNPEGLRNTNSLFGMAWTHPLHWSSDRDEVQDFEHTIRGPLMQGIGLVRGPISPALGEPLKGRSAALDALSAYSNSHRFPLSPHAKGGLSEAAQRGKTLFFSQETRCASCHSGPFYTDSTPVKPYKLHDVGTGHDDPSEKMGPKYDTPPLLGVYRTAPYLHHGRAKTLEEVLTTYNKDDRHGRTSQLSPDQIADLVEFMKALPYEDPEPAAQQAGLIKIER